MAKTILLNKNHETLVSDDDYEILNQWKWHLNDKGYAFRRGHKCMESKKQKFKTIRMHRLIINAPDGLDVDHINGNRLDNRRENLRLCTRSQNHQNRTKSTGKSSKYKGVDFRKNRGKWRANIKTLTEFKFLGHFDTEIDAALAYDKAAREHFGEFAKLNLG
jgi:hypothetical protein